MLSDPRFIVETELTTPFHDVDVMDVVWHGNYFHYFEMAHEALLNQFNYGYRQTRESGYLQPAVGAQVKHHHALISEQRIRVRAYIEEFEDRLQVGYQIPDAKTGRRATTGYTIQVAVDE